MMAQLLAYVIGTVERELLLRNYSADVGGKACTGSAYVPDK